MAFIEERGYIPEWFVPRASAEDWWKGFRQLFPARDEMGLAVVALRHSRTYEWLYPCLRGLPFGTSLAAWPRSRLRFAAASCCF